MPLFYIQYYTVTDKNIRTKKRNRYNEVVEDMGGGGLNE